ncbi:MAG: hypothetical protein R3C18_03080 [Planctomycetaceae bacterium]
MGPHQPLPFRRREDVEVTSIDTPQTPWILRDPLTNRVYRLGMSEHFVWSQLDGTTTADEIAERFFHLWSPLQVKVSQVLLFVQQLLQQELLVPSSGAVLPSQPTERGRPSWSLNPLAVRLPGIDPRRFLDAIVPYTGWLFSLPMVLLGLLFVILTVSITIAHVPKLQAEIYHYPQLLGQSWYWMLIALAAVKCLHELGHAISCHRFGRTCREMGVMFLVGTPCLYCDVTDSWMLKSRWQRASVAAAGIYVELVVAACAAWVWMLSLPDTIHVVALHLMVLCSLNTLLLNGNPLLRYDGYYVFSDLLGLPNLRSNARRQLQVVFANLLWGIRDPRGSFFPLRTRAIWLCYGIAASLYIWLVLVSIISFAYHWLLPYGWERLAIVAGVVLLGSQVISLANRGWSLLLLGMRSFNIASQSKQGNLASSFAKSLRFIVASSLMVGGIIGLLLWPLPSGENVPAVVVAAQVEPLYVNTPGIWEAASANAPEIPKVATANTPLIELKSAELERETIAADGELKQLETRRASLERRRVLQPSLAMQLSVTETAIQAVRDRINLLAAQREQLKLRPSTSGVVLVNREPSIRRGDHERSVPLRTSLIDHKSSHWFPAGFEFARVVSKEQSVTIYVPQSSLQHVKVGQHVRLCFPETTSVVSGEILEMASSPISEVPENLIVDGRLPLRAANSGIEFAAPVHEVRVSIVGDAVSGQLTLHQTGTARILLPPSSLWTRMTIAIADSFPGLQ